MTVHNETHRQALQRKHPKGAAARTEAWLAARRDAQPIVTSCGLCDRVVNRGPALWGRVAFARHQCREHPRKRGRK